VEEIDDASDFHGEICKTRPMVTEVDRSFLTDANGDLHDAATAESFLLHWKLLYDEELPWILAEERRFVADGKSISEFEAHVSGELRRRMPLIEARRAERKRLIADPKTRGSVAPRNVGERMEFAQLTRTEKVEAEAAVIQAQADAIRKQTAINDADLASDMAIIQARREREAAEKCEQGKKKDHGCSPA
jgi:hypothetical protein